MLNLSQLKDALTVLGVSTATGDLRGKARRDELARRLHHARVASGEVGDLTEERDGLGFENAEQRGQPLSLSELRSALDLRQISTQTPGLKGDARRHALIQRLMHSYSSKMQHERGDNSVDATSSRLSSSDDEADDTKSETSSSAYSTATEFIFYDSVSSRVTTDPELQLKAKTLMPQLSFTLLKARVDGSVDNEKLQQELFELRTRLHTARQEQHKEVQRVLVEAGIATTLSEISTKLQAVERERRRLQDNYFGHELVTSEVLTAEMSASSQVPLEFVQEDALVLLGKRQDALKLRAERTKEAMVITKSHVLQDDASTINSARQEEEALLQQIQKIEASLCAGSCQTTPSLPLGSCKSPEALHDLKLDTTLLTPVLVRCRSIPIGLCHDVWQQMGLDERRQLHSELRTVTSFHIRRDRVSLGLGTSKARMEAPSPADRLGMKARFMEKAKRDNNEIIETYLKALDLDGAHAENLGNYALFLCTTCSQMDQAHDLFQRALEADPSNAKNLANYANFLNHICADFSESDVLYKRALQAAPKDVNILGGYADLLSVKARRTRDDLLLVQRILTRALSISPSHTRNQLRLAVLLAELGEKKAAGRCFDHLVHTVKQRSRSSNNNQMRANTHHTRYMMSLIYESYANFLHKCEQWACAKEMYSEALALDPQRPSLLRTFSCFLRECKNFISPRSEHLATSTSWTEPANS